MAAGEDVRSFQAFDLPKDPALRADFLVDPFAHAEQAEGSRVAELVDGDLGDAPGDVDNSSFAAEQTAPTQRFEFDLPIVGSKMRPQNIHPVPQRVVEPLVAAVRLCDPQAPPQEWHPLAVSATFVERGLTWRLFSRRSSLSGQ